MAVTQLSRSEISLAPGPIDVHAHPRAFDTVQADSFIESNEGYEGKAGLGLYTEVALRSGIVAMLLMPNEALRRYDPTVPEQTLLTQFPIATLDRVMAMQAMVNERAIIPAGLYFGLDPASALVGPDKRQLNELLLEEAFAAVTDEVMAIKLYLADTTGGNNIPVQLAARVAQIWHKHNPEKPMTVHVEGADVARLFADISKLKDGKDVPLHVAHISSEQELMAVIEAKRAGLNVTCEVTVHHLFLDSSVRDEIGAYGVMKPPLKEKSDIDFIWRHLDSVDIFASDCAPHRRSDKEAATPAYGVTNHTVMLPLLLGAVADGRLTLEQIDQKLCVTPRRRFNLPDDDGSEVKLEFNSRRQYEAADFEHPLQQASPFSHPALRNRNIRLAGRVLSATGGQSAYSNTYRGVELTGRTSYRHLLRPKSLGSIAVNHP